MYTLRLPIVNFEALRPGSYLEFYTKSSGVGHLSSLPDSTDNRNNPGDYFPRVKIPKFPSSSSQQMAATCCSAYLASWLAVWPSAQYGLTPTPPNVIAMRPIAVIVEWILKTSAHQNELYLSARLKGLANWWRYLGSSDQLWPSPKPLQRLPMCTPEGVPDLTQFFRGSLSRMATSHTLIRLARFSRALPPGGNLVAAIALEDHRALMIRESVEVPGLATIYKRVAAKVSLGRLSRIGEKTFELSTSASLEKSRSDGGASAQLRKVLWENDQSRMSITYEGIEFDKRGFLISDDFFLRILEGLPHEIPVVSEAMFHALSVDAFGPNYEDGCSRIEAPLHRVVAVPDRGGFKVRVITTAQAVIQALSHSTRRVMYPQVLGFIPTKHCLVEGGLIKFFTSLRLTPEMVMLGLGPWVALSSDLKNATDLFPQYLVEATNDGFEQNLDDRQKSSPGWVAWRSLSGPQRLFYPGSDPSDLDSGVINTSGNLMGTAPSWVQLNMFNLSMFRSAWSIWTRDKTRRMLRDFLFRFRTKEDLVTSGDWDSIKAVVRRIISDVDFNPFVFPKSLKFNDYVTIIGDDLGALCPFGVAVLYEIFIELADGLSSPGKHYVMPWAAGNYLLIAEEAAYINADGSCSHLKTETFRALSGIVSTFVSNERRVPWATIGTTLDGLVSNARPTVSKAMCSYGHSLLAKWRRILLSKGLPVYLPVFVGGLGWPHPKGLAYAMERTSLQSIHAYQAIRGFRDDPIKFITKLAALRSSWFLSSIAGDYADLYNLIRSYLYSIPMSRNEHGALAPLTADKPMGLINPDIESISVDNFVDYIVRQGVNTRYLTAPHRTLMAPEAMGSSVAGLLLPSLGVSTPYVDEEIKETPFRSISAAAKRYSSHCRELIDGRAGYDRFIKRKNDVLPFFQLDKDFLRSFHICVNETVREVFPNLVGKETRDLTPAQTRL
nr:MAG: RNA-dependent RNA polymerase [Narnaviridae sp.]